MEKIKKNTVFKLVSIWLLGFVFLFNISIITHGTSFEDHSWVSLGAVEGGVSLGCLAFRNETNTAIEIGLIYGLEENSDQAYGIDFYKFKDFSRCTLFGSIGLYSVRHCKYNELSDIYYYDPERELAFSIGIQYDFSKFDLGFGYHSVRGPTIQLQFIKSPLAKSSSE